MTHSIRTSLLLVLASLFSIATDIHALGLKADYQFQNSSNSSVSGAPDALESTTQPNSYVFATETVYGESRTVLTSPSGVAVAPTTAVLNNNGVYSV